jgi:hypothetical protein
MVIRVEIYCGGCYCTVRQDTHGIHRSRGVQEELDGKISVVDDCGRHKGRPTHEVLI